jgi:hypothetical protein
LFFSDISDHNFGTTVIDLKLGGLSLFRMPLSK